MGAIHKVTIAEVMRKKEHKEDRSREFGGEQGMKDILGSPWLAEERGTASTQRRGSLIEKK